MGDITAEVIFRENAEQLDIDLMQSFYVAARGIQLSHLVSIMRIAEEHPGANKDAAIISVDPASYEPVFKLWHEASLKIRPHRPGEGPAYETVKGFDDLTTLIIAGNPEVIELKKHTKLEIDGRSAQDKRYAVVKSQNVANARHNRDAEANRRQVNRYRHAIFAGRSVIAGSIEPASSDQKTKSA